MYSISKEESSDKHMVICQCLMYGDPYILEADNMIYWHVNRAIDYDSDYLPIMKWVLANYGSCPTSPFNGNELLALAKKIIEKDPENWIAKRFL